GELAQAVAWELASAGAADIRFADPSAERAGAAAGLLTGKLPAAISSLDWEGSFYVPEDIDVLIHALSLAPQDAKTHLPVDAASLRPELIVADLAVNPDEAWLLHEAAARGCKTIDGLGMLVEQMAVDFRLWTLLDPDRHAMREAVEEFLEL
ncbi:MAG: shikimate dehydrogenase, partial [Thermoguttaceae bacterium]